MAKHVLRQTPQHMPLQRPTYTLSRDLTVTPHGANSSRSKVTDVHIGHDLMKTILVTSILLATQIILSILLTRHIIHVNNVHF